MKRDAHYYAVLALCRACGFSKESALEIAYASQFVDDAKVNLIFINNPGKAIEYDIVENRAAFFNMATCHAYFWLKTFNYEAMVSNTIAFHFVPGCQGNSFTKKLRCKEESPVIAEILNDVMPEDDLIKLGISLHALADTFSHQGFSGMLSKVNDIKHCQAETEVYLGLIERILYVMKRFSGDKYDEIFDRIMPAYGHGQAIDFPDIPHLVWSYEYDYSDDFNGLYKGVRIDNKLRYKKAFARMKEFLKEYLARHDQYADKNIKFDKLDLFMDTLVLESTNKKREEAWLNFLVEQGLFSQNELEKVIYDENKWLQAAFLNYDPVVFFNRRVEEGILAENFADCHWYRFYLAIKWYKKKFFHYCRQYGVCFPS